jgi:Na+-driven multidrug efflux pump
MGLGTAAGILAAQNLGAGQPVRAEKTAWLAIGWFSAAYIVLSVAGFVWAANIVRIFNAEPGFVTMAANFLKIQIVGYVLMGVGAIIMNVLNSVGDTLRALAIDMLNLWGVRILLAYLLPRVTNLGVYGVRWSIVADAVSSAIMFVIYLRLGFWKRKKV